MTPLFSWGLVACAVPVDPTATTLVVDRLVVDGRARTVQVHLPPDPGPAMPLVLALHGAGGTGAGFDRGTGGALYAEADRRGWIVAAPDGLGNGWNDGRPLSGWRGRRRREVDDVAFLREVVDRMIATRNADPTQVYAVGMSNGGFMALRLAVELPDRFAAVAAVAATLGETLEGAVPAAPVSVMVINGTADPLVPYGGGMMRLLGIDRGRTLSTDDTVEWWRDHDGCEGAPAVELLPDRDPQDGTHVEVRTHGPCREGSEVVLVRVDGGGHTWPGGAGYLPEVLIGPVSRDVDAGRLIFEFFAAHRRTPR